MSSSTIARRGVFITNSCSSSAVRLSHLRNLSLSILVSWVPSKCTATFDCRLSYNSLKILPIFKIDSSSSRGIFSLSTIACSTPASSSSYSKAQCSTFSSYLSSALLLRYSSLEAWSSLRRIITSRSSFSPTSPCSAKHGHRTPGRPGRQSLLKMFLSS